MSTTDLKDDILAAYNRPEVSFDCPEERKFSAIAEVKANLAEEGRRSPTSTACG